jgi:ubiquinone/menaquinone biosynthesis C-methylase UbiE
MRILAMLLLAASFAWPQVATDANKGYKTKEGRERVAGTLGDPARDERQKPNELIAEMKLERGMSVADVGTGIGYMLPFLSKAVGPAGKVYGEDIQTDFLDKARAKIAAEKLGNVELVLGTENDSKLPAASVNVVLVLDTYHHFDFPDKMLATIARGLKPRGRLVIVDFYKAAGPGPGHIRLDREDVIKEIEGNGFKLLSKGDHLPGSQYIAIFQKL